MSRIKEILILALIFFMVLTLSGCVQLDLEKYAEEIQKNPSFCDKFSGEDKDSCYFFAAGIKKEPGLCSNIVSEEGRKKCYFEVKGMVGFDLEDCPKLSNQAEKTTCYFDVAETITPPSNVEVCKEWPDEWSYICYTHIAKTKYNVSICNKYVSDEIELEYDKYDNITLRESCYESVAITNSDPSLCKFDKCFERIAISTKNLSLCKDQECYIAYANQLKNTDALKLVKEEALRLAILTNIADENTNPEICVNFKEESLRNECFALIAQKTNNIKICEQINIKPFVQECWINDRGARECTLEGHSSLIPTLRDTHKAYLDKTEEYKAIECYLPIVKKDSNKCDDVAYDSMKLRNACYFILSIEINNSQICNNIVIPEIDNVTCEDYLQAYNLESHLVRVEPIPAIP